jgi:hypothetical protein
LISAINFVAYLLVVLYTGDGWLLWENLVKPIDNELIYTYEDDENDPIQAEIDAIRLKIYEETKGMNAEEYTNYIQQSIDPVLKEYGIKTISTIVERKPNEAQNKTI